MHLSLRVEYFRLVPSRLLVDRLLIVSHRWIVESRQRAALNLRSPAISS
jgi:hypothetical protein